MAHTLQGFLANAAQQAAVNLEKALLRLPEDKRNWSPQGKARTALDMVAECAILNGTSADLIKSRTWPTDFDYAVFHQAKIELAQDQSALLSLLHENTDKVIAAIRGVPDEDLGIEVMMPWGPMTMAEEISYAYWNMSYHEGQINYIASMLGCLD